MCKFGWSGEKIWTFSLCTLLYQQFRVNTRRFRVNSQKFRAILRKFRVISQNLSVYSRKLRFYSRKFRVISRKFRVNSRKLRVYSRKFRVYITRYRIYTRRFFNKAMVYTPKSLNIIKMFLTLAYFWDWFCVILRTSKDMVAILYKTSR